MSQKADDFPTPKNLDYEKYKMSSLFKTDPQTPGRKNKRFWSGNLNFRPL